MPIEIKELVIRTVLESGKASGEAQTTDVEMEVKKQLKKFKTEIVNQCIEAVNDGLRRREER